MRASPKGALTTAPSSRPDEFFPGTPHNYQVYVPAQYDREPADRLHDLSRRQRLRRDRTCAYRWCSTILIAKRDLPPMIAMFIDPGIMPALSRAGAESLRAHLRDDDSLTPRFANFLIEEFDARGRPGVTTSRRIPTIMASPASAPAASARSSPRGIARITSAAVITWVGSFGNFRGADRLPGLIRRTEPRPIRVFMQTGRQDLVNYAGSWYLENPRMAAGARVRRQRRRRSSSAKTVTATATAHRCCRTRCAGCGATIRSRLTVHEAPPGVGPWHVCRSSCRGATCVPPPPPPTPQRPPHRPRLRRDAVRGSARRGLRAGLSRDKLWQQVGDTYQSAASPAVDQRAATSSSPTRPSNRIYKSDAARRRDGVQRANAAARAALRGRRRRTPLRARSCQPNASRLIRARRRGHRREIVAQNVQANDLAITKERRDLFRRHRRTRPSAMIDAKGQHRDRATTAARS